MKTQELIDNIVDEHKECRWLDAGELREYLEEVAKAQKAIDDKECETMVGAAVKEAWEVFIEKACEWLKDQMHIGSPEKMGNIFATTFLSVTPDFLGEFRKAMEIEGISGNNKGIPSNLTWQDVRKIVEIADEVLDFQKMGFIATEDYGWSSEEAFYSYVLYRFNDEKK